jgi:hypothetical protein
MRRLSSTTLSFDDVKGATTKDLELGTFNVVDKCVPYRARHFLVATDAAGQIAVPRPSRDDQRALELRFPGRGYHSFVHPGAHYVLFVSQLH